MRDVLFSLICGVLVCILLDPSMAGRWAFRAYQGYTAAAAGVTK